jgi:enterochelin esterase-like enzyme
VDDGFYYGEGGGGVQFIAGIRDTLKPAIDLRYRTLPDAANTGITGVSLGGELAAYAGIAHSETFGNVAAFSPSYWLRSGYIEQFVDSIAGVRWLPGSIRRYYQDTGTNRDNWIGGMEEHLLSHGFASGVDFLSLTVPDGTHIYGAWAHRYPEMLKFLFPPE